MYAAILRVKEPWAVEKIDLQLTEGEVHLWVALPTNTRWVCPECQLISIPAVSYTASHVIVAEIGIDMARFPTVRLMGGPLSPNG